MMMMTDSIGHEQLNRFRRFIRAHAPGLLGNRSTEVIDKIKAARLTYLSRDRLIMLAHMVMKVQRRGVPGKLIEAGCALGGSTVLLAKVKSPDRQLQVYDVFGMIPPPTDADTPDVHRRYQDILHGVVKGIAGDPYYGYITDLLQVVTNNLRSFDVELQRDHVQLVKGLIQETLIADGPVAFAHIDVDWYEPVRTCLERIFPKLATGGVIVLDDYFDWGGCRKATDEFLLTVKNSYSLDDSAGSLCIFKR